MYQFTLQSSSLLIAKLWSYLVVLFSLLFPSVLRDLFCTILPKKQSGRREFLKQFKILANLLLLDYWSLTPISS